MSSCYLRAALPHGLVDIRRDAGHALHDNFAAAAARSLTLLALQKKIPKDKNKKERKARISRGIYYAKYYGLGGRGNGRRPPK